MCQLLFWGRVAFKLNKARFRFDKMGTIKRSQVKVTLSFECQLPTWKCAVKAAQISTSCFEEGEKISFVTTPDLDGRGGGGGGVHRLSRNIWNQTIRQKLQVFTSKSASFIAAVKARRVFYPPEAFWFITAKLEAMCGL